VEEIDTEQCQLISPPTQWEIDTRHTHDQFYSQYTNNLPRLLADICSVNLLPPVVSDIVAEYAEDSDVE
jgi:hypothetical protein